MSESEKIKVGISIGDPHGVGIEIILKVFEDKRMFDFFTPIVYGNTKLLSFQRNHLKMNIGLFTLRSNQKPHTSKLNVVDVWKHEHKVSFGKVSEAAGKLAVASLEAATKALIDDEVSVLVTAPIHKQAIQSKQFKFPGMFSTALNILTPVRNIGLRRNIDYFKKNFEGPFTLENYKQFMADRMDQVTSEGNDDNNPFIPVDTTFNMASNDMDQGTETETEIEEPFQL